MPELGELSGGELFQLSLADLENELELAPPFAGNVATSDAATVVRLKTAGAHFIGKTNVPRELAESACTSAAAQPV